MGLSLNAVKKCSQNIGSLENSKCQNTCISTSSSLTISSLYDLPRGLQDCENPLEKKKGGFEGSPDFHGEKN